MALARKTIAGEYRWLAHCLYMTARSPSSCGIERKAAVAVFRDASFGNRSDQGSQCGYLVTLLDEKAAKGKER